MIYGQPKKIEWNYVNCNHYGYVNGSCWVCIHPDKFTVDQHNELSGVDLRDIPKFESVEQAKEFVQKKFDEFWLSITEVVFKR